jgi:hypothetical protein
MSPAIQTHFPKVRIVRIAFFGPLLSLSGQPMHARTYVASAL